MSYLRDYASIWKPSGKMDIQRFFLNSGFVLEFQSHISNDKNPVGVPYIWRKTERDVVRSQTMTFDRRTKQTIEGIDAFSGGLLRKVVKKLKSPKG
jgi:hypothetical protein